MALMGRVLVCVLLFERRVEDFSHFDRDDFVKGECLEATESQRIDDN